MFIDARTVPENTIIETDVCIVGAGAAGITLAREFIGQPFRVCLLESGGVEYDNATQSLSEGENIGLPYFPLVAARLRFFGGTTNHWAGWCAPLDGIDFETREWIPHSGWPFGKSHLDPFYERAQPVCQLGPFAYDAKTWETESLPSLPFTGKRVITKIVQFSPPTRFGQVYRHEIERADNISTYLYANVVDIDTTDSARAVTRLRVACLQGNKFRLSAKLFILATGGIENPRLLLASNRVQSSGVGNQNDLVGRFFMEHPHVNSGLFLPSNRHISRTDLYIQPWVESRGGRKSRIKGLWILSAEALRREKLLNFSAALFTTFSEGVRSLKRLLPAIQKGDFGDFVEHLRNVIGDIDDVAVTAYGKFVKGGYPVKVWRISSRAEPAPNPDSRVTLSTERDSLGMSRVRLDWRLSGMDKRSITRAHEIIGEELGRAGLGRLKITLGDDDSAWPPGGGWHHMGTTRMHVDPKKGVVNENCRVHGISNLYIAGSSVFPTSGSANPTLTIVALSLRLADHVKRIMKR